jgi:hypothetical protein
VLALSAIQELKELTERADGLWPAVPEKLPELDRWLDEARVLVDGTALHPGLKEPRDEARRDPPARPAAGGRATRDRPAREPALRRAGAGAREA